LVLGVWLEGLQLLPIRGHPSLGGGGGGGRGAVLYLGHRESGLSATVKEGHFKAFTAVSASTPVVGGISCSRAAADLL
jgi:hypothetical protein